MVRELDQAAEMDVVAHVLSPYLIGAVEQVVQPRRVGLGQQLQDLASAPGNA